MSKLSDGLTDATHSATLPMSAEQEMRYRLDQIRRRLTAVVVLLALIVAALWLR